jgi:hypothetical protein
MGLETESNAALTGGVIEEWLPREIAGGAQFAVAVDTSEFSVLPTAAAPSPNHTEFVSEARTAPGPDAAEFVGDDRMNLNAISFESLRAMGVSVEEAARFVAYRQRRGGYLGSLDEVDTITGLSHPLRGWLKAYGAV